MKKEIKNAINWLEALKSGKYKQRKHILGDLERGFCCWGLGCYITGLFYNPFNGWDSDLYLKIGFYDIGGKVYDVNRKDKKNILLSDLNDYYNWNFFEIADFLINTAYSHFIPPVAEAITKYFKHKS